MKYLYIRPYIPLISKYILYYMIFLSFWILLFSTNFFSTTYVCVCVARVHSHIQQSLTYDWMTIKRKSLHSGAYKNVSPNKERKKERKEIHGNNLNFLSAVCLDSLFISLSSWTFSRAKTSGSLFTMYSVRV